MGLITPTKWPEQKGYMGLLVSLRFVLPQNPGFQSQMKAYFRGSGYLFCNWLQGGPLPFINGLITPINGLING